jgi:hypothetical protein
MLFHVLRTTKADRDVLTTLSGYAMPKRRRNVMVPLASQYEAVSLYCACKMLGLAGGEQELFNAEYGWEEDG